jgi:UDP-N-acetyl-D-galactosamine dehydrogenase
MVSEQLQGAGASLIHRKIMKENIAVIGLGYVGLPVAIGFARHHERVVGFDISKQRTDELLNGHDVTGEISAGELRASRLVITNNEQDLSGSTFFIVTVPTPIDLNRKPDLGCIESACEIIGKNLKKGGLVVFESTVYPGVTENVCARILEKVSGLRYGPDFKLGYSPERINPGDKQHRLEDIVKVVSGSDAEALDRTAAAYEKVITAGLFRAASIKVAEAAKVLENTQRDLNIALMNELAIILDRMGIRTRDVLNAANTKWNFLPFSPGLVGGHCIGVDPYYLTSAAEALGYHPQVILAGRRVNDDMGKFVARKAVKLLIQNGRQVRGARVAILGLTFKENVPDLRNSKVTDILNEMKEFGIDCLVHDPLADAALARHEYGVNLAPFGDLKDLDVLILAVAHHSYLTQTETLMDMLGPHGIFLDVKSAIDPAQVRNHLVYWSL